MKGSILSHSTHQRRSSWPGRFVLVVILTALGSGLAAQQSSGLRGKVSGPDGEPVAGVYLVVAGTRSNAVTDRAGRYELRAVPPGTRRLDVEHLGFRPVQLELVFRAGSIERRDIQLEVVALPGEPLEVNTSSRATPQLQGFYLRLQRRLGYFVTPEDIERMQVRQLTDVLRRVPGLRMQPTTGPFGTSYVVEMARTTGAAGSRPCPVLFYLNGMPFPVAADIGIDNFVRPDEIAGIEVYAGSSNTPSQFSAGHRNARCGVIVIWTHTGHERGG